MNTVEEIKIMEIPKRLKTSFIEEVKYTNQSGNYNDIFMEEIKEIKNTNHSKTLCFRDPDLTLIPALPPGLKELSVLYCKIQTLPELPATLEYLYLQCSELKTLPSLPPSLKILHLSACTSLERLPEIPPSLEEIYAYQCFKLIHLPEFPPTLKNFSFCECNDYVDSNKVKDFDFYKQQSFTLVDKFLESKFSTKHILELSNHFENLKTILLGRYHSIKK